MIKFKYIVFKQIVYNIDNVVIFPLSVQKNIKV